MENYSSQRDVKAKWLEGEIKKQQKADTKV